MKLGGKKICARRQNEGSEGKKHLRHLGVDQKRYCFFYPDFTSEKTRLKEGLVREERPQFKVWEKKKK